MSYMSRFNNDDYGQGFSYGRRITSMNRDFDGENRYMGYQGSQTNDYGLVSRRNDSLNQINRLSYRQDDYMDSPTSSMTYNERYSRISDPPQRSYQSLVPPMDRGNSSYDSSPAFGGGGGSGGGINRRGMDTSGFGGRTEMNRNSQRQYFRPMPPKPIMKKSDPPLKVVTLKSALKKKLPATLAEQLKEYGKEPIIGLTHIIEYAPDDDKAMYDCTMCKVTGDAVTMGSHVIGYSHKRNVLTSMDLGEFSKNASPTSKVEVDKKASAIEIIHGRGQVVVKKEKMKSTEIITLDDEANSGRRKRQTNTNNDSTGGNKQFMLSCLHDLMCNNYVIETEEESRLVKDIVKSMTDALLSYRLGPSDAKRSKATTEVEDIADDDIIIDEIIMEQSQNATDVEQKQSEVVIEQTSDDVVEQIVEQPSPILVEKPSPILVQKPSPILVESPSPIPVEELKTTEISKPEEVNESVVEILPEVTKTVPQVTKTVPQITKTVTEITKTLPEVTKALPEITKTLTEKVVESVEQIPAAAEKVEQVTKPTATKDKIPVTEIVKIEPNSE